jgi:hypothetical protein
MWMTKFTSPYGTEQERFGRFFTDKGFQQDEHGNLVLDIGKSKTMFAAHMDTADQSLTRVRRRVKGDLIGTDGKSILGADDRAGLAVLLHLIRNDIPGRYVLFVGEEAGRQGSSMAAADGLGKGYDRVVCWDRMGDNSIITHQMGERSCSTEFADALGEYYNLIDPKLKLENDPSGTYTDSYSFMTSVPECTNISIGYENAHSVYEFQDARFLAHIADASLEIPWEELPLVRDPYIYEATKYDRWDDTDWTYYDNLNTQRYDSNYRCIDDLETSAAWNTLTLNDVRQFVFNEPEESARALYEALLKENKR